MKIRGTRSNSVRETLLLGEKVEKDWFSLEPWQWEERRKEKITGLRKMKEKQGTQSCAYPPTTTTITTSSIKELLLLICRADTVELRTVSMKCSGIGISEMTCEATLRGMQKMWINPFSLIRILPQKQTWNKGKCIIKLQLNKISSNLTY